MIANLLLRLARFSVYRVMVLGATRFSGRNAAPTVGVARDFFFSLVVIAQPAM